MPVYMYTCGEWQQTFQLPEFHFLSGSINICISIRIVCIDICVTHMYTNICLLCLAVTMLANSLCSDC